MSGVTGRWRWLGAPWFLLSVGVLAVNDHVLKARFPGWWTGKLSDVAGLAVVAVAGAVVLGVRPGVVAAGLGFVVLKTVPGAAELAAPVLGGVTRRDATDLVALLVLGPVYAAISRHDPARTSPTASRVSERRPGSARRVARGATVLPVLGATLAMFATTATSCGPRPAVDRLVAGDGGVVYAQVTRGWESPEWARTSDGGRTWTKAERPPGTGVSKDPDPYEAKPAGPLRACGADGTCFRLRRQRRIEVTTPDGTTVQEFALTERRFDAISTGCAGAHRGLLTSVVPSAAGRPAMASLGADGVIVRQADGRWSRVTVLGAHPPTPPPPAGVRFGPLLFGPVLAGAIWLFARHRWPSWRAAIVVAVGGWVGSFSLTGVVGFLLDPDSAAPAIVLTVGCAVTLIAAVAVGRSRAFDRRPPPPTWHLPPPPLPPPPPPVADAR